MAVKRGEAVVAFEPRGQHRDAARVVDRLVADVRDVVARVGVPRILTERKLGQAARLGITADLVVAEPERGLKPPVVAVVRSELFHERHAILLAVFAPAQADRAGRLVHQQGVAGEFLHVLLDQPKPAGALATGARSQRLYVLPPAPPRPSRQP